MQFRPKLRKKLIQMNFLFFAMCTRSITFKLNPTLFKSTYYYWNPFTNIKIHIFCTVPRPNHDSLKAFNYKNMTLNFGFWNFDWTNYEVFCGNTCILWCYFSSLFQHCTWLKHNIWISPKYEEYGFKKNIIIFHYLYFWKWHNPNIRNAEPNK